MDWIKDSAHINYKLFPMIIASTESYTATNSWVCLMMRLKSFRSEVDKSWRVTERMPKKKASNK